MPVRLPLIVAAILAAVIDRAGLIAENLALRQQLSCPIIAGPDPSFVHVIASSRRCSPGTGPDGANCSSSSSPIPSWPGIARLQTLLAREEPTRKRPGRRRISLEVRRLIVEMANSNIGWGAPRIHGELLKLGIEVSQATVSRTMPKRPPRPRARQSWATFLDNHRRELFAIDFAVVPCSSS